MSRLNAESLPRIRYRALLTGIDAEFVGTKDTEARRDFGGLAYLARYLQSQVRINVVINASKGIHKIENKDDNPSALISSRSNHEEKCESWCAIPCMHMSVLSVRRPAYPVIVSLYRLMRWSRWSLVWSNQFDSSFKYGNIMLLMLPLIEMICMHNRMVPMKSC